MFPYVCDNANWEKMAWRSLEKWLEKRFTWKAFQNAPKGIRACSNFQKLGEGCSYSGLRSYITVMFPSIQIRWYGPEVTKHFKTFEDDFRKVRLLFGVSKRDKCHNFKCIFLKAERKISWFQEHSSWSISFPLRYLTKSGHYLQCKPSKRIWTACYLGLIISNSLGLACEQVQIFAVIWTVEKCTKSFWLKLFLTM